MNLGFGMFWLQGTTPFLRLGFINPITRSYFLGSKSRQKRLTQICYPPALYDDKQNLIHESPPSANKCKRIYWFCNSSSIHPAAGSHFCCAYSQLRRYDNQLKFEAVLPKIIGDVWWRVLVALMRRWKCAHQNEGHIIFRVFLDSFFWLKRMKIGYRLISLNCDKPFIEFWEEFSSCKARQSQPKGQDLLDI